VRPEGLGKFKISPHRDSNPQPSGFQVEEDGIGRMGSTGIGSNMAEEDRM
jgi:hypothetical protein